MLKSKFRWVFNAIVCCSLVIITMSCSSTNKDQIQVDAVQTQNGFVKGFSKNNDSVSVFLGIPFAAPPVGENRWKAPQPMTNWDDTLDCTTPPASAEQGAPQPFYCWTEEFLIPKKPISEDCLYLNVWTTAKSTEDKKPVIVWIHGGGLVAGSGTVPLYDGTEMAKKDVVFITINYRLGIFGFLAHPALSEESDLNTSGNYGVLDQIAALKWVKENVTAFGGDPDNITIAGQSAGAFSVNMLMVSPLAKGLFHKAIAQSGGMFGKKMMLGNTLENAEKEGEKIFEQLNVRSLSEMRSLSADSLLKLPGRQGITVDEIVIPAIVRTFEEGLQHDVPLLTGWNLDDGVNFGPPPTAEQAQRTAKQVFGDYADEYLELFPAKTDQDAAASQKLYDQLSFAWNNYSWARLHTKTAQSPAYLYQFSRVPPGEPNYGAFHSAEFAYALHTLHNWDKNFEPVDYQLEDRMSTYWVNFAKTGNPNGEGLAEWPVYSTKDPKVIELGTEVKSKKLPYKKQLFFFDKVNGF